MMAHYLNQLLNNLSLSAWGRETDTDSTALAISCGELFNNVSKLWD